jgi:hypothetical protein
MTPMGIVGTGPILKPQGLLDRRGFWTAGAFGPQEGIGHPNAADRLDPEEDPKDVGAERPCIALGSAVALLRSSSGTPWAAPAPNLLAPHASQAATHSSAHLGPRPVQSACGAPRRVQLEVQSGKHFRELGEGTPDLESRILCPKRRLPTSTSGRDGRDGMRPNSRPRGCEEEGQRTLCPSSPTGR